MLGPRSGDLNNLTRSGRCYTRCYSHSVLPRHAVFNVAPWLLSESACFDCSPDVLILAYSYLRGAISTIHPPYLSVGSRCRLGHWLFSSERFAALSIRSSRGLGLWMILGLGVGFEPTFPMNKVRLVVLRDLCSAYTYKT